MENVECEIARLELATAHRALAFYGWAWLNWRDEWRINSLNEGVNNHITTRCQSKYDPKRRIILMLPFGTLWSEARPDDMLEIDPLKKTIVTKNGDVELDFITRSSQLLMEQPLDAAFYLHSEIYAKYSHIKGTVIDRF